MQTDIQFSFFWLGGSHLSIFNYFFKTIGSGTAELTMGSNSAGMWFDMRVTVTHLSI